MESMNSQATASTDAGVVAAGARLDYAVDLLIDLLVPVKPLASDESGAVERELADPIFSEWKKACTAHAIKPMCRTAEFMHEVAGEIETLCARIRLSEELHPIIDAELGPFPN